MHMDVMIDSIFDCVITTTRKFFPRPREICNEILKDFHSTNNKDKHKRLKYDFELLPWLELSFFGLVSR